MRHGQEKVSRKETSVIVLLKIISYQVTVQEAPEQYCQARPLNLLYLCNTDFVHLMCQECPVV